MVKKDVFVTVTGPPVQYEGIDNVLKNVQEIAKVNQIFFEPKCFIETGDLNDIRIPPLDLDGSDRVLERPLSGKKELYGKLVFPFEINEALYEYTPYRPIAHQFETDIIADTIKAGHARNIKVNLMLSLLKVPNLDKKDYSVTSYGKPRLPAISNKGCVNNPRIRQFGLGFLIDMVSRYKPDGVFVDWLEYTNYHFEDNLLCFCDHCKIKAAELGFDFNYMRHAAVSALEWVKNASIDDITPAGGWNLAWERISPNIAALFDFKAKSVESYIKSLRERLEKHGFGDTPLYISGFAPPMNKGTGMDYGFVTGLSNNVMSAGKLYRFHWALMVGWYAEYLSQINKKIAANDWIPFVLDMLELKEETIHGVEHYRMPRPGEVGPLEIENEKYKLEKMLELASVEDRVIPLVHAYCPKGLFRRRIAEALNSDAGGMIIQRYGYASDEKLAELGDLLGS